MNLSENQIKALPLEEQQKLVMELRQIQPSDKAYPNAKAIIELITGDRKFKEPATIKAAATEDVSVDGRDVKKGQAVELFPWQHRALSRFFEVTVGVAKAAALMLAAAVLLASSASAQTYKVSPFAGLNTGTNVVLGGSSTVANVSNYCVLTITTTIITNPVVTISNGTAVFTTTYTTNSVTNTPGVLVLTKTDRAEVCVSFVGHVNTVSNTLTATFYKSIDGTTNNAYPAFVLTPGTAAGTSGLTYAAGTNYDLGSAGYLILMSLSNSGTNTCTNVCVQAATKPVRSGQ